jgi:hypothetical protein
MDLKLLARNEKILQLVGFLFFAGAVIPEYNDGSLIPAVMILAFGVCTIVAHWLANREKMGDRFRVEESESVDAPIIPVKTKDKLLPLAFLFGGVLAGVVAVGFVLDPVGAAAGQSGVTPDDVRTDAIRLGGLAVVGGVASAIYWYLRPERRGTAVTLIGGLIVAFTLGKLALGLPVRPHDLVALVLLASFVLLMLGLKIYNRGETA